MGLTVNISGKELLGNLFSNGKIHGLSPWHGAPSLRARSTGTWCTLAVGLRICGHDLMKRKGMRSSNLHHPIRDGWLRLSSGAQRQPAQCMRRHQGRLTGVEPSALSGGSLATRSTSTWSTEDGGSHHSLRGRRWGRARASDEEVDTRKDGEVGEGAGLVVLLRLRFLSQRRWWPLLFLSDQAGETKAQ
jgi:hypothetical protein